MCCCVILGIFAYLNYLTPRAREEILSILLNGLKRLEYRGYDSAGYYFVVTVYLMAYCFFVIMNTTLQLYVHICNLTDGLRVLKLCRSFAV